MTRELSKLLSLLDQYVGKPHARDWYRKASARTILADRVRTQMDKVKLAERRQS